MASKQPAAGVAAFKTAQAEQQAARTCFFSSKHFAVAGASSDPKKFGNIVLKWYLERKIPVTPINPRAATVTVESEGYPTVASPSRLPDPKLTSMSVVTPPVVTAKLLKEAKECGIRAVWLQPGTYDDETREWVLKEFPGAAVIGCILIMGNAESAAAGYSK